MATSYEFIDASGKRRHYVDTKRYWWLLSVVYPLLPVVAIGIHFLTGLAWTLAIPLLFSYLALPLLDWLLGEDSSNPPEQTVPALEHDRFYRNLVIATVPLHYVSVIVAAWWAATAGLSWWAWLVLAVTAGLASGMAINTGHELGHKRTGLERWMARLALAVPGYGHFSIEHNIGHHKHVATPEDCASARFNESIYGFALREIPGGIRRAWRLERARLNRQQKPVWHWHNEILGNLAITIGYQAALVIWLGWPMLAFLVIHNAVAWFQLTSANYIEHYGLLRQRRPDGRYERCQPHHSWNSNHVVTNLLLFHLQRHSDHHANPLRRYQSLRDFDHLPQLPSGYLGMYLLAYVPPLWFRIMNRRLLALDHVKGDLSRVNRGLTEPARTDS